MGGIHPSAVVAEGAEVAQDANVGPFAVIGSQVKLAPGVTIGSHAVVDGRTRIGAGTTVFPFATVGTTPQDLKYEGEDTELIIGERNQIREYVNISIGTVGGGGRTVIGDDNLIMVYTHIAHDCQVGNRCVIANAVSVAGHVVIGDQAVIGGMAGIHQFVRIGDLSMTAAGSMVAQDVPPYAMVHGDRASFNGLNVVGLRRAKIKGAELKSIKTMYHTLYRENLTLEEACDKISQMPSDDLPKQKVLNFLTTGERGICR